MFDYFASITLSNTFFDQCAVILVKGKILRFIFLGSGLIHRVNFTLLFALVEVM